MDECGPRDQEEKVFGCMWVALNALFNLWTQSKLGTCNSVKFTVEEDKQRAGKGIVVVVYQLV